MCGVTGFWSKSSLDGASAAIATAMAERIAHRGPDDHGLWLDPPCGVAIAHRRLSILDLTAAGHQPMSSASGRWVISYNGEIYNHGELRECLAVTGAAPPWRGHSDTETLLAAIEAWGVEETLKRSVGMFALACWDRAERALWLARDRIGEKPMYYGRQRDVLLFGSELKALRAHPAFAAEVDRDAVALLLRYNYIPAPHSIYRGIHKLPAGCWVKITETQQNPAPVAYWSLADVAEQGTANPFAGSEDEALDVLDGKLGRAIRGQMVADVPLGVLLSGGIDSTLVAAIMQTQSAVPVRTFTIGFDEREYDEATHARAVAAHLGTQHTDMRLNGQDALALIPRLPAMYDEPFADSSQLPTHLVMQLARRHVTVALSGDGGDEFFGGYNRYFLAPLVWKRMRWLPAWLRHLLGRALTTPPQAFMNRLGRPLSGLTRVSQLGDKLHRIGNRLGAVNTLDELYLSLASEWQGVDGVVLHTDGMHSKWDDPAQWPALSAPAPRMMAMDALTFLPDDILVKVDRAAMAVSLETRAPFLDRDLMTFAWSLPLSMKVREREGKWLLRRLLARYVPRELTDRPKMGFSIPLDSWLRGPLRAWGEQLLSEDRLRAEGFFDAGAVRNAWARHARGACYGYRLWSVLMFQAWLEHTRGGSPC